MGRQARFRVAVFGSDVGLSRAKIITVAFRAGRLREVSGVTRLTSYLPTSTDARRCGLPASTRSRASVQERAGGVFRLPLRLFSDPPRPVAHRRGGGSSSVFPRQAHPKFLFSPSRRFRSRLLQGGGKRYFWASRFCAPPSLPSTNRARDHRVSMPVFAVLQLATEPPAAPLGPGYRRWAWPA